ncbi:MAG: VCBS domain-containing protein, partial [Sedimenticola sp.]
DPSDDAYSSLGVGDSAVVTVPVTVTDEHGETASSQIQVTVRGTNDAPVAAADVIASVGEGDSTLSGQLSATDVDSGASLSYSVDGDTPAGFELSADGIYSFDPSDDAYSSLGAGDSTVVTVPVTVTDEHGETAGSQIQVTVSGTNDAPVAAADVTASVGEGDSTLSGQLSATDVDSGTSLSYSVAGDTPAGFELSADGSYSFDPSDDAYGSLGVGDSVVVTVPVTVTDEHGETAGSQIQITVQGTNDAPAASADVTASVGEGDSTLSGQLSATDMDSGASLSYSIDGDTPAGFELSADGSYSFDPSDDAYSSLGVGDSAVVTVPVTVTDEHGETASSQIQVTVSGTNDAPVAAADVTASVGEGDSTLSGQLSASDMDSGASLSYSVAGDTPAGFELSADGSYNFDPSNDAYSTLGVGDSAVVTVPVTVTDETGATDTSQIQVTVQGTNDAPVASADVTASVGEGDSTLSGQLSASDVDTGAELTYSVSGDAPAGFELNANGSYSFDPSDDAYSSLGVGDSAVVTVPVTVTDDQGATDTTQIQITVTGTNNAPVAISVTGTSVTENAGAGTLVSTLAASDPDSGETFTYTLENDPSGNFEIVGNQILVKEGADIDFESAQNHEVTVQVTDSAGNSYQESITFTVNDLDDMADTPTLSVSLGEPTGTSTEGGSDYAIQLNESGNNDALQIHNGGELLYGNEELTIIMNVKFDGTLDDDTPLLSYATEDNDNEFLIELTPKDNDQFRIDIDSGGDSEETSRLDNSLLFDGEMHEISISIDSNGDINYNIDGNLVGTDHFEANDALNIRDDSGVLIIGQEQDSVGASFDDDEYFQGQIGDIKIYDTAEVTEQSEPIGHWDMNQLDSTTGTIEDQAGNHDISVISIDESGFTEGSEPTLVAIGEEGGEDTLTYPLDIEASLTDTDGSESLAIIVSGIPEEATLSAGTDNGNGSWSLSSDQLDGLSLSVPAEGIDDFDLSVTATSTESEGGAQASVTVTVNDRDEVADTPTLNISLGEPTEGSSDYAIQLNEFGNNDALQIHNGGELLYGNEELTITMSVKFDGTLDDATPLISYATEDNDNELRIELKPKGDDQFRIDIDSGGGSEETGHLDNSLLFDGEMHEISISIDSNGDISYKIDGNQVATDHFEENSALNIGDDSGVLIIGQEQDSVGGSFDDDEYFQGQIGVIKIYDTAEVTEQSEPIGHWDMNQLDSTTGTIEDQAGNHDISVISIDESGFMEGGEPTLVAIGEEGGEATLTYPLDIEASLADTDGSESLAITVSGIPEEATLSAGTDNGDGSWSLSSDQLDGLSLSVPAEGVDDFDLSVTATSTESEGGAQTSITQSVTAEIPVIGVENETPTDIKFSNTSVDENAAWGTLVATLQSTDQDTGETFSYELVGDASGHFEIIGDKLMVKEGADIDFESSAMHPLSVQVTDSGDNTYTESVSIHVSDVYEASIATQEGSKKADHLEGDQGDDIIMGGDGKDEIEGGKGDDELYGEKGNDDIDGGEGDDLLSGGSGNDELDGGEGDDVLKGGDGNDELEGDDGNDLLVGGAGNDELKGGEGDDILYAGSGKDTMDGGKGDDTFVASEGKDTAEGGEGNDTFTAEIVDGSDYFSGGNGEGWTDVIQLNADVAPGDDPDNPWVIEVDGEQVQYDIADHALSLNPDTSGVVTFADGSELSFDGVERIEW